MRTDPVFSSDALASYYDQEYRQIVGPRTKPIAKHVRRQIITGQSILNRTSRLYTTTRSTFVVDWGCGAGATLVPFVKIGANAQGYEPDAEYAAVGRALGLNVVTNPEFVEPADIVILNHVLEHARDPLALLLDVKTRPRARGIVYVAAPNVLIGHRCYRYPMFMLQHAHCWYFTEASAKDLARAAGFEVVRAGEELWLVLRESERGCYLCDSARAKTVLAYLNAWASPGTAVEGRMRCRK